MNADWKEYILFKNPINKGVFFPKEKFGFLAWLGSCLLNCEHSSSDLINAAFYASPSSPNDEENNSMLAQN